MSDAAPVQGSPEATQTRVGGFADWLGVRIAGWSEEGPYLVLPVRDELINRNGSVHGGVLLTLLDSVCSLAGLSYEDGKLVGRVTAVSVTANFIAPISKGTMHARSRLRGGGRKLALVDGEIRDDDGNLIATGSGVIRRIQD
ncbi:MAG: PaaI family thioesterase [Proteobacteria bacterium]|nr:PaaI family thioesterase [Pseudomonadota bacterium]